MRLQAMLWLVGSAWPTLASAQGARVMKRDVAQISRRGILAAGMALTGQLALRRSARAEPTPATPKPTSSLGPYAERFVQDCVAANNEREPQAAVLEVLKRALHTPRAMLAAVGEPH